jgi:ABC-2 type transport system permease protein
MRNILAIAQREFTSYFYSPLAYFVVPVFLGLVGIFSLYFQDILASGVASMRVVFFWCAIFQVLLIPAITMRLFAEERRTGSIELLATLPVSEAQMVLGKYIAALGLISLSLTLTLTYPMTISDLADLDTGPVIGGYVGLFLLGASFAAIGTAASAMTRNQVVAFLVALVLCMVPFAMGFALGRLPADILPVVQYLAFDTHFKNMARGVIDSRDIVYYLSIVALFLHLAVFSLERRRLS